MFSYDFKFKILAFFSKYGYDKILKIAGRSYRDFLYSIDQLHESNNYSFPLMKNPLFFVGEEDSKGLYLHYE
jgi:guanylate cyclase